jgi:type I restriction enzyme, S subunit
MSSDWRATTLGEVSTWASGGTPKKDEPTYWGGDIPWISANSMHATRFFESDLTLTEAGLKNGSRLASKDTVLLLVRGSALHSRMPVGIALRNLAFNQDVKAITAKTDQIRPWYLLYWLMGNEKFILDSVVEFTGIGAGKLDTKRMQGLDLMLPPLAVQDEILESVKSIDDRITLLRETNTTLEAIAQALFKSWFVDFDPVHAKMQGRAPEGMDEATAALFPDSFEESELGPVPKGWSLCPVYDLATFINGAAYKAFEPNAERRGLPIIKIAELKSGVSATTAFSAVDMPEKYLIESGDILFSWSGNPDTSIDTFVWSHEAAWLNQHIFRVLPNEQAERAFVLQTLRCLRPVFAELARNKQTTGLGHVTVADLKRLLVVKPDSKSLDIFNRIVGPVQQRIFENERQATSLASLRDTLLPRLISGQLQLPEASVQLMEALQ